MIISRTPFRVSFVGGGTDLRAFYKRDYGAVVSVAIDKYMYVTVNKRFDSSIRVSYSRTEIVDHAEQLQHPIIREALKMVGISHGIEITSVADIPAQTGLGSSSAFTVGLLHALYAYSGVFRSAQQLAEDACRIEIEILGEPIGRQDQYAVAFGGMNHIQFNADETVFVNPIICPNAVKKELKDNLLLFYTGQTRSASSVLSEQKNNTQNRMDNLLAMRAMVDDFRLKMIEGNRLNDIGGLLHEGWLHKKKMAGGISNPDIDRYYEIARKNGAIGGKVLGAGGGGFILLFCERQNQQRVSSALSELRLVPFDFEPQGSKIIFVG